MIDFIVKQAVSSGEAAMEARKKPPTFVGGFHAAKFSGSEELFVFRSFGLTCHPHWDMLPVTGYGARLPLLNHFGFGRICFFYNNFGNSDSSRMEGIRNTWALLRIRLKFLGAWRIGWSLARGLILFAFLYI